MWPSMSKTAFTDNTLIICPFCCYPATENLLKFQAIIGKQSTACVFFTASLFALLRMCFTISWLCFSTLLPSPWRPLSPRRTAARASICCPTAPCAWPTLRAIYSPRWTTGSTVLTWWPRWASQHSLCVGGGVVVTYANLDYLSQILFLTDFCICDDPVLWLQLGDGLQKMEDVKGGKQKLML